MIEDEIRYVENPKEELLKMITNQFGLLLPFEVSKGYRFQIRISEEQYNKLSDEVKQELSFWQDKERQYRIGRDVYGENSEELENWMKNNYWTNCKAYIFDYISENSFVLSARCEYGYEGKEESYEIVFMSTEDFAEIIYKNHDASERKENFNPDLKLRIEDMSLHSKENNTR